jgi:hypothetical protein
MVCTLERLGIRDFGVERLRLAIRLADQEVGSR